MALRPAEWSVVASAVAGVATATRAAEPGRRHYITGVTLSGAAAPAAAVSAQVRDSAGANIRDQIEIPAAIFPPIIPEYESPIEGPSGASVDVTLPSLGGAVRGTATIRGYTL
jgi:hypothetical protein